MYKFRERDLINCSKKLTFNSHYVQTPHDHEQTVQIGHSSYDSDKTRRQKHRRHCHTVCHECHNAKQIPPVHGGNGSPPNHNGSSIGGDSEVSSVYTCFACGTDGHISRFCSQLQSLADHGPHNNILYPHGPQLLENGDCHEQKVQALTPGNQVDKRDKPHTQSSAKPNRTGNRF